MVDAGQSLETKHIGAAPSFMETLLKSQISSKGSGKRKQREDRAGDHPCYFQQQPFALVPLAATFYVLRIRKKTKSSPPYRKASIFLWKIGENLYENKFSLLQKSTCILFKVRIQLHFGVLHHLRYHREEVAYSMWAYCDIGTTGFMYLQHISIVTVILSRCGCLHIKIMFL